MSKLSFVRSLVAIGVAVGCFGMLVATSPMLPMAWDEGNAINRASGVREWCGEVRRHGAAAFGEAAIARHWHYTVEIEGHPALYGVVIALGQSLAGDRTSPLMAARLGPMLLFSLAAGAMFHRLWRQYSLVAALGGVAALLTMPRLFAHAHFASFDGPLTSCWILAWAIFLPTRGPTTKWGGLPRPSDTDDLGRSPHEEGDLGRLAHEERAQSVRLKIPRLRVGLPWAVVWGVALGAAMSCKFTGWLGPLPFIGYAMVYGDRNTAKTITFGLIAALVAFWLANPRLWHHPLTGTATFFELNLNRAGTHLEIPTTFFGQRYDMQSPLPWYNTLVWTAITVPLGILGLGIIGIASVLRRWAAEPQGTLILGNWLVLIIVRALPGTPVHDAERLILPSFAFLAALAGIGTARILEWACARSRRNATESVPFRLAAVAFVAIAYLGAAANLVGYSPQWLSYYSPIIGGLRGADVAGMEATYYWDALDTEVLDWLHEHTGDDEKTEFSAGPTDNLALMARWGVLRRGWRREDPGEYRWYVIQRRPTFWQPRERWLVEHEQPAFSKTIRPPTWGVGPWRLDVPLILVYSTEQRDRADASCRR